MNDAELTWQLLGAYEVAGMDFDRWCMLTGLEGDEAVQAYDLIHTAYATLWLAMGDTFHVRLWPIAEQWRARHKGRVGLAIGNLRALLTGGAHA